MNNKGSVLIFVLVFIAFAASTALLIHEHSTKSMEEASEDFYENQANIYSMTTLTAVIETIKEDDNAYDSPREDWALIPVVEVPYGYISVDIKPLNSKIAINGMADSSKELAERYLNACTRISEEMETDSLECDVVKDYIDADTEVSYGGTEDVTYEWNDAVFHTKNKPLSTLYELRMLMGDNEQFGRVKNYLTVYSPEKAVNINFADELTIKAFIPELEEYAEQIVNYTKTKEYKDPSNIKEAVEIPQDIYLKILPFIAVKKSTLFYVKTEVTLNDKPRYFHALVKKKDGGGRPRLLIFWQG